MGFSGISLDFNLLHCNEFHIYFFSLVYFKKRKTKKLQHISFLKVFVSCCLTHIIIWKPEVTLDIYFAFFKISTFATSGNTVLHTVGNRSTHYLWFILPLPSAEPIELFPQYLWQWLYHDFTERMLTGLMNSSTISNTDQFRCHAKNELLKE